MVQNASSGEDTIYVEGPTNFTVGDEILIIQMQNGSGTVPAGEYEFRDIAGIDGQNITLDDGLEHTYQTGRYNTTSATITQVVRVPQYTNVTVEAILALALPWPLQ